MLTPPRRGSHILLSLVIGEGIIVQKFGEGTI